jgi:hypothetical protein
MFDWLWRKPSERPVAEVPEMPLAYKFEPQADITAYEIALLMTEFVPVSGQGGANWTDPVYVKRSYMTHSVWQLTQRHFQPWKGPLPLH